MLLESGPSEPLYMSWPPLFISRSCNWPNLKIWFGVATAWPQGGHVAGFSRPFDRPRGRPRSGEPRLFYENPFKFLEINPRSRRPLRNFYKKRLVLFPNQRSVQTGWALVCLQKRPPLYRKSTRAPQTLSPFFAKTSSDFSQIKIQPNFDYIFFSSKKYVWPVDRAHGRARKTSVLLMLLMGRSRQQRQVSLKNYCRVALGACCCC